MTHRHFFFLLILLLASPVAAGEPAAHWSFAPVKRPVLPAGSRSTWPRNGIDRFILARLEARSLAPSPEADRATLIRRLKFDLLGLPPTPEEVAAFVRDPSPDAYARLVECYLASPHFGERWARHWLDVVRFAESDGFETNQPRPNAWPYRDWVIGSFNRDLPYDQFIQDQLAGDQRGADAATGFLVAGAYDKVKSPDPVLTAMQRADELHDIVGTTASAFLGLTVGCARCHDHKFDPISQSDYYAIKAVFEGVQHGERPLRTAESEQRRRDAADMKQQLDQVVRDLEALEPIADPRGTPSRTPVNSRRNIERITPILVRFVRFTIQATNGAEPCIDELELYSAGDSSRNVARDARATSSGDYPGAPSIHRLEFINDGQYGNSRSWISNEAGAGWVQLELKEPATIDRVVWGRDREGKFADRTATRYRIEVATQPGQWQLVASSDDRLAFGSAPMPMSKSLSPTEQARFTALSDRRVALERGIAAAQRSEMTYAGTFAAPPVTHRLHRGDPMQPREPVVPAGLKKFGAALKLDAAAADAKRRLELARWIADPRHPLPARVIVNRLWHYHFGIGLVDTPSDFGRNGSRPTHPELLDFLADELVQRRWSLKHIHRLIVTSATYRQSGDANAAGVAADAGTRLLWRYPPRRLEAEVLRDAILSVSGNLDARMGGPGFDLFEPNTNYVKVYNPKKTFGPADWRRMVYQSKPRMQLDDTFGTFDCPDAGQIAPRRNNSTTALQALSLLNGGFALQQSTIFADRVRREHGDDIARQVQRVFDLAYQRAPRPDEAAAAQSLVRDHGLAALCRAVLNSNEFVYVR